MQSLITIRKYTLPLEAELARIHLESRGVRAVLLDLNISGLYRHLSSVFPVRVLVATDDLLEAERILKGDFEDEIGDEELARPAIEARPGTIGQP